MLGWLHGCQPVPCITGLPAIPILAASPAEAALRYPDRARALIRAAADTFGLVSRVAAFAAVPVTDRLSLDWMQRTGNPYLPEIRRIAELLGVRGVYTLNICFEWGCTSGVWPGPHGPVLRRVLDWGF